VAAQDKSFQNSCWTNNCQNVQVFHIQTGLSLYMQPALRGLLLQQNDWDQGTSGAVFELIH